MDAEEKGAIRELEEKVIAVLREALEDDRQFFRYLVKTKAGADGDLEERVFRKLDTKELKEVVGMLKELKAMKDDGGGEDTLRVIFEAGEEEWNE